jgi:hypothetical protein
VGKGIFALPVVFKVQAVSGDGGEDEVYLQRCSPRTGRCFRPRHVRRPLVLSVGDRYNGAACNGGGVVSWGLVTAFTTSVPC